MSAIEHVRAAAEELRQASIGALDERWSANYASWLVRMLSDCEFILANKPVANPSEPQEAEQPDADQ